MNKLHIDRIDLQGLVKEYQVGDCEEKIWQIEDIINNWLCEQGIKIGGDGWNRNMLIETVDDAFEVGWRCCALGVDHITIVADGDPIYKSATSNQCIIISGSSEKLLRNLNTHMRSATKQIEQCSDRCNCTIDSDLPEYD